MPPRLRKVVNAVRFNSSSSEGDDGSADDAAWTPAVEEDENAAAAAEAADAEAGGVGAAPKAAAKAAAAAPPYCLPAPPRPQLTPEALSSLLLALPLAAPCRLAACDATAAWVRAGGLRSPAVVPAGFAAELGFRLPASLGGGDAGGCSGGRPAPPRSARDLAPALLDALGPDFPVPVVDVGSQQEVEHGMRLGDFLRYFTEVKHKQLLNVVSLSLAGTQLDGPVAAPSVVRDVDLVAASWPEERNDTAPAVQLYALLSPAGCYTDWHLDFGGSSVWYAIAAGRKAFAVAPPSDRNLSAFFRWASSSKQAREFLGASLHDAAVVTVGEGEVLLLPGGWPHAVVTPADTLAFGGNFLHTANCGLQCTVARMEEKLGVVRGYSGVVLERFESSANSRRVFFPPPPSRLFPRNPPPASPSSGRCVGTRRAQCATACRPRRGRRRRLRATRSAASTPASQSSRCNSRTQQQTETTQRRRRRLQKWR